ncbi:MAG: biotin--[acetyl-CoA-carboxylase] ligase [Rickettsiales bacterium]|jgi:BirA family biotin operon repressor/biotin-[acetyl-CoA-carboxylase] ligase|nr:biotin--[acetyl-CoA-carboxylase] ligase [Rickettsiales bacterium]
MENTNYKLLSFDKIPSTQTTAAALIRDGKINGKTIILADKQSAGRGRYRRVWISEPGNLYASFVYNCTERDSRVSYAIAVAVANTLIEFGLQPEIKWPNDILIDGKKICGILIEYLSDFIIIGIGINIKSNPKIRDTQTTKISDYNSRISRDDVLGALIKNMNKNIDRDFLPIKKQWTNLAMNLGEEIIYRGINAVLCGLNDDGGLILRRGMEYITIYGDEISY